MNPSAQNDTVSLDKIGLFSQLSAAQRRQIESIGILRHYDEHEIVFYEGNQSEYFHFLVEGEAVVFKSTASIEPMVIHRFHAPSLIAEVATLRQIPYPASCEATSIALVLKISRDPFLDLLKNDPSLSIALIASLTTKIAALEVALQRHSAPSALAKVARLIRDDRKVFEQLTGVQIAQMLGITPETLSRMIKKLKSEGIISLSKKEGINLLENEKLLTYCG
ncbi:MAG: Crp/Fnr family transcriptional regulator [Sulfuricurvum sp.]|uniref:Crp/Fnr family transcriptional regulator n=1 Tax=Sulfuricurvum sp. TaxID=2025608 RepID=UPI0025F7759D|nr:Crp/Fnr family transcriptional regulator [Sulfuricurvum sp.]MCI4407371.1 Crp/Fnr family transcriptional regulator [Sulfuricurvum sp.]